MAVLSFKILLRSGAVLVGELTAVVADRVGVVVVDVVAVGFTFDVSSSVSDSSSLDSSSLDSSDSSSFLGGVVVRDWRNLDWKGFFSASVVELFVVDDAAAGVVVVVAGRDRIGGTSVGLIDAGPGEAASLELSVDELSLDERAGGESFCVDALVVVVYK